MMHRAWSSIVEVPYCFSRSYVKFQGHTALKIVEFDPNWAFPDSNTSLNSPMAMKCCTKLETAKERCPIVFQGHPSNFKVTRDKTPQILTQIGRFLTIGRSQLSNPSDLPWLPRYIYLNQYILPRYCTWKCPQRSAKYAKVLKCKRKAAFVCTLAWCQLCDSTLSKPMMTRFADGYLRHKVDEVLSDTEIKCCLLQFYL